MGQMMTENVNTTKRPRWLRYSLRGLLVMVLVLSVALAGYVWLLQDLHEQQAIEARLNELGCRAKWDMEYREDFPLPVKRAPTVPIWVIELLGGDPNSQITAISVDYDSPSEGNADKLHAALSIANDLQEFCSLSIQGDHRDPPRSQLDGFRAPGTTKMLFLSRVDLTDETLREIGQLIELKRLSVHEVSVPDDAVHHLSGLTQLKALTLDRTNVTSACLPVIGQLTSLDDLSLRETKITDAKLESLQSLRNLEHLDLTQTNITSAALPKLAKIDSLNDLSIGAVGITDENLEALAELPNLNYLSLYRARITDAGLPKLAQLRSLKFINLRGTIITGDGLSHFASIPGLRLDLSYSIVDDRCVDELLQCTELSALDIEGTNISIEGWRRLKDGLPDTHVSDL